MTRVGVPTTIEPRSNARLAAEGDEYAFARLISEHSSAMMRVAFVIAGDWSTAQDAVQSAWTLAWKKLPSVRDPAKLEAWLVSIAANETRTILRRTRRRMVVETHAGPEPTPGSDPDAAIDLVDLRNALRRLSPDDRALVAMRYLSGFDATQIGAAMGISSSGVRSRLGRILERLRKDLEHG
jgi:RNA polymerase sigma-70 factor (ECF subfamily)